MYIPRIPKPQHHHKNISHQSHICKSYLNIVMITLCLQEFEEKVLQERDKQNTGTPGILQRKFVLSHVFHILLTMHGGKRSEYTHLPVLTNP